MRDFTFDGGRRWALSAAGMAAAAVGLGLTGARVNAQPQVQLPKPKHAMDTLPTRVSVPTEAPVRVDVVFTTDGHQWFFGGRQDGRVPTDHPLLGPTGNIRLLPPIPAAFLRLERAWELVWADGVRGPQGFTRNVKVLTGAKAAETREISESLSKSKEAFASMTRNSTSFSSEREESESFTISAAAGEIAYYAMWQLVDTVSIVDASNRPIAHNGIWRAFNPAGFPTDEARVKFFSPPPVASRGQRYIDRTSFSG